MLFVNAHLRAERLATCRNCEHYVEKTKSLWPLGYGSIHGLPLCGCYMPAKTSFKTASCPLDKWEATVTPEDVEQIREFLNRNNDLRTKEEPPCLPTSSLEQARRPAAAPGATSNSYNNSKTSYTMPIPKPENTEKMTEFLGRCMADTTMTEEYPNERQRMAICAKQWRDGQDD